MPLDGWAAAGAGWPDDAWPGDAWLGDAWLDDAWLVGAGVPDAEPLAVPPEALPAAGCCAPPVVPGDEAEVGGEDEAAPEGEGEPLDACPDPAAGV